MPVDSIGFEQIFNIAAGGARNDQALELVRTEGRESQLKVSSLGVSKLRTMFECTAGEDKIALAVQKSLAERVGSHMARAMVAQMMDGTKNGIILVRDIRMLIERLKTVDCSDALLKGLGKAEVLETRNVLQEMDGGLGLSGFSAEVLSTLAAAGKSEAMLRTRLNQAARLLSIHAFSDEGMAKQILLLTKATAYLGEFEQIFKSGQSDACREMASRLEDVIEELNAQKVLLAEQMTGAANDKANIQPALEARYEAAVAVVMEKIQAFASADTPEAMARIEPLKTLALNFNRELVELRSASSTGRAGEADLETLKALPGRLARRMSEVMPGVKVDDLKDELNEAYRQVLNRHEWKVVSRNVPMFDGKGGMRKLTSTMTPSNRLGNGESLQRDGISGVGSADRSNVHASNLWSSRLTVKQRDGSDKTLFLGMRHGVMDAFGIRDPDKRRAANIQRVKEFFVATLHAQPNLLERAVNGEEVELPVVSTSLLGPNWFTPKETKMLANQNAAWRNACNEEGVCELNVDGRTIRVKPKVITFNYAVDMWSQSFGLHAWRGTRAQNEAGLRALIGDPSDRGGFAADSLVGRFLRSCRDHELEMKVRQLAEQIRTIHTKKLYKKWGADPYAMPARIALLAHLTGAMPAYNCKSGKDRTGQLDVAVKSLAFLLDQDQLPDPTKNPTRQARVVMNKMAANSGNLEVQRYNAGVAGSKTAAYFSNPLGLKNQFSKEAFEYYKGLQSYAKS